MIYNLPLYKIDRLQIRLIFQLFNGNILFTIKESNDIL